VSTLEAESSSVEQDLSTVGKRKLAVAKIFALLLILRDLLVIEALSSRSDNPLASNSDAIGGSDNGAEERSENLPSGDLENLGIDDVGGESTNVLDGDVRSVDRTTKLLVNGGECSRGLGNLGELEGRKVRAITLGHLANLTEGSDGPVDNTASLGVTDSGLNLDEAREKLGNERPDSDVRVDKLGHVVNDTINRVRSKIEYKRSSVNTYTATFRLVAVSFSFKPRERSGTMSDRVGESTSETNVVAERS
jgi:hypothetical protein